MIKCVLCVEPCLNLNVNTTQKIYRNCLILNTSSKDISLQSKCVYCSIINSVDRKLMQSKHHPYVMFYFCVFIRGQCPVTAFFSKFLVVQFRCFFNDMCYQRVEGA